MLSQSTGERSRAPHEDAAIPVIISGGHKLFRALLVRLFRKPFYPEQLRLKLFSGLNISITGFGAGGLYSHDHNMVLTRGKFDGALKYLAKLFFVTDDVICR